ncbi:MAG: IPT/TIG domain-containing protein [candidate division KSB1 bacterium]|nr:IPT/TIG domain-containing protein [candidate division KSB1 bacterium]
MPTPSSEPTYPPAPPADRIAVTTPNGTATSADSFTVTQPTPPPAPAITSFTPTSGPEGTEVSIVGSSFTGATAVEFNGVAAATFIVDADTLIRANVPAGATSGPIAVTTPNGTATSADSFTVTQPTPPPAPAITSFTPTSGPEGTEVSIVGSNFTGATAVEFNGVAAATFIVDADTLIRANVPAGATSGPIAVTTPNGTATSADSFTVTQPTPATPTVAEIAATTGGTSDLYPNQSRVFYHAGSWWMIARAAADGDWYLWQFQNNAWQQLTLLETRSSSRLDLQLDPTSGRLYVLFSHRSTPKLLRMTYDISGWVIDSGYPKTISSFAADKNYPMSFVRDSRGEIWVFQIKSGELRMNHSADEGQTWDGLQVLATGLGKGLADCGEFYQNGVAYVGVGFADGGTRGIGFLSHRLGGIRSQAGPTNPASSGSLVVSSRARKWPWPWPAIRACTCFSAPDRHRPAIPATCCTVAIPPPGSGRPMKSTAAPMPG